jgi:hypothetical protein
VGPVDGAIAFLFSKSILLASLIIVTPDPSCSCSYLLLRHRERCVSENYANIFEPASVRFLLQTFPFNSSFSLNFSYTCTFIFRLERGCGCTHFIKSTELRDSIPCRCYCPIC